MVLEPEQIPGMIEPVEQRMLTELAASGLVAQSGAIVEFGSFLGRSTACLIKGARTWWTPQAGSVVVAYDSFGCADGPGFAPHVLAAAERGGVAHLVRRANGRVDFAPVFRHFVGEAEGEGMLRVHAAELRDSRHDGRPIALLHLDSPKYYEEFKVVLFRFFPALVPGAKVVFQDYFYHWSASLVAAIQLLLEGGYLRFESSAASSLLATVLRTPTADELLELDLAYGATPTATLLDRSLASVKGLALDRPAQFVPRLALAKLQHLWERGDTTAAQRALGSLVKEQGGLNVHVFNDLQELMSFGFSLRKLYDLDH